MTRLDVGTWCLGQSDSGIKSHRVAIAFGASFGAAFIIVIIVSLLVWWRYRHNQQIFFDVNGKSLLKFSPFTLFPSFCYAVSVNFEHRI